MRKPSGSPRTPSSKPAKPQPETKLHAGIVGKVVVRNLTVVRPNDWNPNEMDEFTYSSLKVGLREDGWLISDSLLIWGKDDKGDAQNLIINGEHRWKGAREIGMIQGPMVFLDGLSREEAMKLTIKLDNKRGRFNEERLSNVVRTMLTPPDVLGVQLGFTPAVLARLQTGVAQAPSRTATVDVTVEYCCPACSHKWTDDGKRKRKSTAAA